MKDNGLKNLKKGDTLVMETSHGHLNQEMYRFVQVESVTQKKKDINVSAGGVKYKFQENGKEYNSGGYRPATRYLLPLNDANYEKVMAYRHFRSIKRYASELQDLLKDTTVPLEKILNNSVISDSLIKAISEIQRLNSEERD